MCSTRPKTAAVERLFSSYSTLLIDHNVQATLCITNACSITNTEVLSSKTIRDLVPEKTNMLQKPQVNKYDKLTHVGDVQLTAQLHGGHLLPVICLSL